MALLILLQAPQGVAANTTPVATMLVETKPVATTPLAFLSDTCATLLDAEAVTSPGQGSCRKPAGVDFSATLQAGDTGALLGFLPAASCKPGDLWCKPGHETVELRSSYSEIPKHHLSTQLKDGPPQWLPAQYAYWDPTVGDWRFTKTRWEDTSYKITSPDLVMFGFKFETAEKNLTFNASLDPRYWYSVFGTEPQQ